MSNTVIARAPIATFYIESNKALIENLTVEIKPFQVGSGNPSSENVRPMYGYTGINVYGSGKNLLTGFKDYTNWSSSLVNYGDYSTSNGNRGFLLPTKNGVTYTISFGISASSFPTYFYLCKADGINTSIRIEAFTTTSYSCNSCTFTAEEGWIYYLRIGSSSTESNFLNQVGEVSYEQLECGSNPTEYTPYVGNGINIAFPSDVGVVFGGTIKVSSGELTITDGNIESYDGETLPSTWISSMDVYEAGTTPTTGAQVVYKLASPVTYQLTPQQVSLLIGLNNMWSDAGDIYVEYIDGNIAKIKLNGEDVTGYFTPRGMKVTYAKVLGSNGGTMLNGDLVEDVLSWKAKVTLACMPLTEAQMADFLTKATADHPTLYYFDPRRNAYRTIHYMADVAEATYKGAGGTGIDYWTGYVLTAEETCEFAITQQPANLTVNAGEYANYSIQASGENLTYQWQYSSNGGTSWTNSTATSGKTPNYRFNASASQDGRLIRCKVSNEYETLISQTATLTVTT